MKNRVLSIILVLLLLFSVNTTVFASNEDDQTADKIKIENFAKEYFNYRQDSFSVAATGTDISTKKSSLEKKVKSTNIIADENVRADKLVKMAEKLEITLQSATTTYQIKSIIRERNTFIVNVYEWTFFDYTGSTGLIDTSGMGVNHELIFIKENGDMMLVADNYDEGPLTEMSSSTFVKKPEKELDVTNQAFDKKEQDFNSLKQEKKANEDYLKQKASQLMQDSSMVAAAAPSGYNVAALVTYSNQWVCPTAYNQVLESYYNPAYKNFNGPDSGDCANYVSQCLYAGGLTMVGTLDNTSSWWYNNKGTTTTSDDAQSSTWTYCPSHRSYMSNSYTGGVIVSNPSESDILVGNPVYYDWDANNNGIPNHVTICVGSNNNGEQVVNSHNNDYYHVKWNYASNCLYSTVKISTTGDDYGNNTSSASTIYVGSPRTGSINYAGDVDYFKYTPTSSGTYIFSTTGTNDTVGTLYNGSGGYITENDDYEGNVNFRISYSLSAYSTYYIRVRHFSNTGTGQYTLGVTSLTSDDHGNTMSTATLINRNVGVAGFINYPADVDFFRFTTGSAGSYTINTISSIDTYGYLYTGAGVYMTEDDDQPTDSDFSITWTLAANTTYYVQVRHYNSTLTGAYTLYVTP